MAHVMQRIWKSQLIGLFYVLFIVMLYRGIEIYDAAREYQRTVFIHQIAAPAAAQAVAVSVEPEGVYDIFIDLSESQLYLFLDGKLIKKYPIAQGRPDTPSPIGIWEINSKARNWGSGFGTRWLGLNVPWGRYGIHGTNKPNSIGYRASHGCFRMRNRDVEELYELIPYKTRVVVWGGPYGNIGSSLDPLIPGDRKSHVFEVQKRLQYLGYYAGPLDGIYGEGMKSALLRFKRDRELPADHTVDWVTYHALGILPFE